MGVDAKTRGQPYEVAVRVLMRPACADPRKLENLYRMRAWAALPRFAL